MTRVAFFPGKFQPPHLGHIITLMRIYKKFDKPIQITYDDNDQNGQRCNQKIYFVIRSTVPSAGAYAGIKPSVYVATKINYYEQ